MAATTIDTVPRCSLIVRDSALTWMSTANTRASVPKAPSRESRIAARARSRPAPNPSATSASPSRCRPRVSKVSVAIPTAAGSRVSAGWPGVFVTILMLTTASAVTTPRTRPTSGAIAMARPMARRSMATGPRTGSTDSREKIVRIGTAQVAVAVGS